MDMMCMLSSVELYCTVDEDETVTSLRDRRIFLRSSNNIAYTTRVVFGGSIV